MRRALADRVLLAGLSAVLTVVGVAAVFGALAVPVAAHTDLVQGSPGPGQRVGGTVDFVDLVFAAAVTEARVEVRGPDGAVVPGETVVADGQIIRHRMEAIEVTGRHVIEYEVISNDGDLTGASYFFDYEPTGFEPGRLDQVDLPDDSLLTAGNTLLVATVVVLGVACLVLLRRLRASRAALIAHREQRGS